MGVDLGLDIRELLHLEEGQVVVVLVCLVHVFIRQAARSRVVPRHVNRLVPHGLVHLLVALLSGTLLNRGDLAIVVAQHGANRSGRSHGLAEALVALSHDVVVAGIERQAGASLTNADLLGFPKSILVLHGKSSRVLHERWLRDGQEHSC